MKYKLRDYQQALIDRILTAWSDPQSRRVLAQMPTGAGKTVIFANIARAFTDRGDSVLVLAHREELLLQAKEKLETVTGEKVGLIKAGYKEDRSCLVQVASVASLINREIPPADLLIIDEAHHSTADTYEQLLNEYPDAYVLGVTATPARIDGQGFKYAYDRLILGPAVDWLIGKQYLSSFKLFAAAKTVDTQGVQKTGADYNRRQLARAVNTSLLLGDIVDAWREFAEGKKTVVFAVNVEHSRAIAAAFCEAGISAEHLDGTTKDDERRSVLNRFATGETLVLSNCDLFTEGFDLPNLEAIQCVRPTQSLVFWLQMVGRCLRVHEDKEWAVIIDHTENWAIHGPPDRPRKWSLDPVSLSSSRWAVVCPECRHVFRPRSSEQKPWKVIWDPDQREFKTWCLYTCPNCQQQIEMEQWQGEGEPPPPRVIEADMAAEIWEIPMDCDWEILGELYRLVGFQRRRGATYPLQWIYRKMVAKFPEIGEPELRECAILTGRSPEKAEDWAKRQFLELIKMRSPGESVAEPPREEIVDTVAEVVQEPRSQTETQTVTPPIPNSPPKPQPPNNSNGKDLHLPVIGNGNNGNRNGNSNGNGRANTNGKDTRQPQMLVYHPQGRLGRWTVRIHVDRDGGSNWQTRIDYTTPNGQNLSETIAGYATSEYLRRIAKLEAILQQTYYVKQIVRNGNSLQTVWIRGCRLIQLPNPPLQNFWIFRTPKGEIVKVRMGNEGDFSSDRHPRN